MVCVDTCFYSVPEYMVGHKVFVKKYHEEIRIYSANQCCAVTSGPAGSSRFAAVFSSLHSTQRSEEHRRRRPKKFIELFQENMDLPIDELVALFEEKTKKPQCVALEILGPTVPAEVSARAGMAKYGDLVTNIQHFQ